MMKTLTSVLALLFYFVHMSAFAETVCMVGDSVTERGKVWRDRIQYYRQDIQFVGNYFDGTHWHDGVGGDKTTDIIARIDSISGCETALLEVGGNDLLSGTKGSIVSQNIRQIADALAAKGITVKIATILPLNSTASNATYYNAVINWTNNNTKDMVSGVYEVVDTWHSFYVLGGGTPQGADLYDDAVHPSQLGYYVLGYYAAPRI